MQLGGIAAAFGVLEHYRNNTNIQTKVLGLLVSFFGHTYESLLSLHAMWFGSSPQFVAAELRLAFA